MHSILFQTLNALTSESTGRLWRSLFFSVSAVPSKVQVTLGRGRPVIVAGILMVDAALQFSKSCALTSRVTVGSTETYSQTYHQCFVAQIKKIVFKRKANSFIHRETYPNLICYNSALRTLKTLVVLTQKEIKCDSVCCTYSECLESGSLLSLQAQSFQQRSQHRS